MHFYWQFYCYYLRLFSSHSVIIPSNVLWQLHLSVIHSQKSNLDRVQLIQSILPLFPPLNSTMFVIYQVALILDLVITIYVLVVLIPFLVFIVCVINVLYLSHSVFFLFLLIICVIYELVYNVNVRTVIIHLYDIHMLLLKLLQHEMLLSPLNLHKIQ